MSEHYNETLEQQKKARKEFLELKKIENGEMNPGAKPSEEAIMPKTFKEKLANFWFHYKWAVIVTLILVIAISIMTVQCAQRPKYDMMAVIYTSTPVPDDDNKYIADYLEQYFEDIDGNGEVAIQIVNCSYSETADNAQVKFTAQSKIQAMLAAESKALIYITDDKTYENLNSISTGVFTEEPILLGSDFYQRCDKSSYLKLPSELKVSCRNVENTLIEKNGKIEKYYAESQKIISGIKNSNDSK